MKWKKIALLAMCIGTLGCGTVLHANADESLIGDVNGNGAVEIADVILLSRYVANVENTEIAEAYIANADCDADGSLDMNDVTRILQIIARIPFEQTQSRNLMNGIAMDEFQLSELTEIQNESFSKQQLLFSFDMLKNLRSEGEEDSEKGKLISPLSLEIALSMTANGADGNTLAEMENVLGGGNMSIQEINSFLQKYRASLIDSGNVTMANGIWFKDDGINPTTSFLQANADYYHAALYASPFDMTTLDEINSFVKENTKERIPKILEFLTEYDRMVLVNALTFDAGWAAEFNEEKNYVGEFKYGEQIVSDVTYMSGDADIALYDENGVYGGFMKMYEGGRYSFVGLLPMDESMPLDTMIDEMNLDKLNDTLMINADRLTEISKSKEYHPDVPVRMPKFHFSYGETVNDALIEMGMKDAFDRDHADFSKMYEDHKVYIGRVVHKTDIEVDNHGTKAAAATAVVVADNCAMFELNLNRPFVYMIYDNVAHTPMFVGIMMNPLEK